jgi:hypothetical protein
MVALLALPLAYANAGIVVGVGPVGVGVAGPPACAYGYYADYPYSCAPYGYYGSSYFLNGVFIGAGPWFHGWGWGHGYYGRGYYGRGGYVGHGYVARSGAGRGFAGRGSVARGGFHGGGSRGGR